MRLIDADHLIERIKAAKDLQPELEDVYEEDIQTMIGWIVTEDTVNEWIPCSKKPEHDFKLVLVRWHDKRVGCENDYYLFEGYVIRGKWCGMFEEVDMSDYEPVEWKYIDR